MFKKNKQLIIGFLLGALVFGTVPASANIQDYLLKRSETKLMVDGKEFADKDLPVLIYEGYNYMPAATFREICDKIGVGFEWVGETNQIQINTNKENVTPQITEERKGEQVEFIKKDGFELLVVDGVEYIAPRKIGEYLIDNSLDYSISYNQKENNYYIVRIHDRKDWSKDEIIFQNIPIEYIHENKGYMNYDFFKDNILPVIVE